MSTRTILLNLPGLVVTLAACLTLLGILLAWPVGPDDVVWPTLGPWAQNGTAAIFLLIWILIVWYRIPTQPLHRSIVRGLAVYLLTCAVSLAILARSWSDSLLMTLGNVIPWLLLLTYWNLVVWRRGSLEGDAAVFGQLRAW